MLRFCILKWNRPQGIMLQINICHRTGTHYSSSHSQHGNCFDAQIWNDRTYYRGQCKNSVLQITKEQCELCPQGHSATHHLMVDYLRKALSKYILPKSIFMVCIVKWIKEINIRTILKDESFILYTRYTIC